MFLGVITIEKVKVSELKHLITISRNTFYESFREQNTETDMNIFLSESFSEKQLSKEFNKPNSYFYFAKINKQIAGYLKLNFGNAQTELQDNQAVEIERIYVLQSFQGTKIGKALFEKTLNIAKEKNLNYIWLGVWEKNLKAIQFYTKNGFVAFDKHQFVLGNDVQTDIMMKLLLK
jgi:ribosomal protein S18 acetylase RimI-like enzyme